ncbi:hypothetical protein Cgig2_003861 [Carnegiea gigantea]|uniref:Uncharacterized protein n=1 Tax=Carnegiea gigantea TaxID=171969 RepID=A0A9Q1QB88_9CARY|nr:hypothetical protein Cgig2_003861 [Carnegiea gigantea]
MGGTNIQDAKACDIQEMQSRGLYFSWTNKIVWTRIDRAFANVYWYDLFGFNQAIYMANSLSDHIALIIDTPGCPKPNPLSNFVTSKLQEISHLGRSQKLKRFLRLTQGVLQHLNRSQARAEMERNHDLLLADPTNSEFQQNERLQGTTTLESSHL